VLCFSSNVCSIDLITTVSKSPSTKTPWLGRLAYDKCNQAKLERFQSAFISCIPMHQFTFSNAIKIVYPWNMESNNTKRSRGRSNLNLGFEPLQNQVILLSSRCSSNLNWTRVKSSRGVNPLTYEKINPSQDFATRL
jgi:hypothetical protein